MTRPSASGASSGSVPRQVKLVRDQLRHKFDGLIDISDITNPDPVERRRAFSSRALAALIACDKTGCDSETGAAMVVDGRDDGGVDAVAIGDSVPHVWLIQTKWSDKGSARFDTADVLKMIDGLRKIDQRSYSTFNPRLTRLARRATGVLDQRGAKVTLVIALMRTDPLSTEVTRYLDETIVDFNRFGDMLDYQICLAQDIWRVVRAEASEPTVELTVKMDRWFRVAEPFDSYSGRVAAGEVADWLHQHGDRLFTRNIRKALGLTKVNATLVETLVSEPNNFWYFNNGITILCDEFESIPFSRSSPHGPVTLELKGASVVNGAQTVAATLEAVTRQPEAAEQAYVGVRVIATGRESQALPNDITKANNTQNHVERRDYVALDPVQSDIREEFALSLQKTYVVKRGEMDPPPDSGCSVVHAAIALACAHTNPELAVRAKRDPDLLWEEGPAGAYRLLFRPAPPALRIWRSVELLRTIRECLHRSQAGRDGRAAAVAEHADLLSAHIVFQYAGLDAIDDDDSEWSKVLQNVPAIVDKTIDWLVYHVDLTYGRNSFIASTFSSPERCRDLAEQTIEKLRNGHEVPDLPAEYRAASKRRKPRRPNAVPVIVDAGRLKDGTPLQFRPGGEPERVALSAWLAAEPKRGRASWLNHRTKPLVWAADGKQYSPTGLVQQMWRLADWGSAPGAVQGTAEWYVVDEGSLVDIADAIRREEELPVGEEAEVEEP